MRTRAVALAARGRRVAESLMLDAGTASRPTGGWTLVDGIEVEATEPLFSSCCKVQTRNLVARDSEVGARTSVSVRTELHLPVDTPPLSTGDIWVMTAVVAGSLSEVGQRLRVVGPVDGTLKTARRYEVIEVVT